MLKYNLLYYDEESGEAEHTEMEPYYSSSLWTINDLVLWTIGPNMKCREVRLNIIDVKRVDAAYTRDITGMLFGSLVHEFEPDRTYTIEMRADGKQVALMTRAPEKAPADA